MAYQLSRPPYKDGMQDLTLRPRKTMAGEMWDKTQRGRQAALAGGNTSVAQLPSVVARSLAEQGGMGAQQAPTMLQKVPPAGAATPMSARMNPSTSMAGADRRSAVSSILTNGAPTSPNAGGTITQGGLTRVYPGSPATGSRLASPIMNSGGSITRGGQTTTYPQTPYNPTGPQAATAGPASLGGMRSLQAPPANPVVSPTTVGAPQTESSNPLTGTGNQQPQGSTGTIRTAPAPAQAMGFSSRGGAVPAGQDALANGGGNAPAAGAEPTDRKPGLMSRQFARPESQAFYDRMVRRLSQP